MDEMTFRARNALFALNNPPDLAGAHVGQHPPWDHEAYGFSEASYAEVLTNIYHPLSNETLRRICSAAVLQTHLYEMGIKEGLEEGYERLNMPAGYRLSRKSISDRFLVFYAYSVYQARTHYIFFPANWNDLRIWNFDDVVSFVMQTKLRNLERLLETRAPGVQPDQNLIGSFIQILKPYNDSVENIVRHGTGVNSLNALTLLAAGPGKNLHTQHLANWFFVGRLLDNHADRHVRSVIWQIEQDEIRVDELIKKMRGAQ